MSTPEPDHEADETQGPGKHIELPPRTLEEWFKKTGIQDWPIIDSSMGFCEGTDGLIGTLQDIKDDLRKHSMWDVAVMSSLSEKLSSLDQNAELYGARFLYDTSAVTMESIAGGLRIIPNPGSASTFADQDVLHSCCVRRQGVAQDTIKCAKEAMFPGFSNGSVALPGKLEALSILDHVTKCQDFPLYFIRPWKKFFYSDQSCAILQNTFWWMWASYFKPDLTVQSELFSRIAESFVSLIRNMNPNHCDDVFLNYSRCLAQALCCAFSQAFPDSIETIDSDPFMGFICDTTSEWISGVKALPHSWKSWPQQLLDQYHSLVGSSKPERPTFSEKDILRTSAVHLKASGTRPVEQLQERKGTIKPSYTLQPGTTYESVLFSPMGRSPLLQYHLDVHGLSEGSSKDHAVKRTEVKDISASYVPYEKQVLQSIEHSSAQYNSYTREMAIRSEQFHEAQKEQLASLRAMQREHRKLLAHRKEVSILAEKLMSKQKSLGSKHVHHNGASCR